MIRSLLFAVLCMAGPLICAGQNVNGEATYVSFSVPGAQGTIPMGINASGTVTGYYYVSPSNGRGFVRTADGTITTFDVMGAVWTQPESINTQGDIAGWYDLTVEGAHQVTLGFLRYADGRTITIGPPQQTGPPSIVEPVSINDFDDIAADYEYPGWFESFSWSAAAGYHQILFDGITTATSINDSGSVVGVIE